MKALKKKTWIALIVGGVILLTAVIVMILVPAMILPVLWLLLVLGLGFLGVEFYLRWHRKKKQRTFDEKVSAKEGIEDRKREWSAWTEDLDRQGIDRYELPFYMIVGEPQSGKSVLLQNSDLHFPFGQDKLSGVGGTRGCDWWFTDEAVILDIAGRLFTHEGGVADRMEWEAFLDLLYEFRPLCPANGILLVIPCDALASDSEEISIEKANKVQHALLTLSQRLQAHLPVYLVLTKGDQVFGFSESVHRLETKNRHEMFGWSRPADKVEAPFDLAEAKAGFETLVGRARLLRERMVATARIPEALPEIDRLYAFPDELAGIYPNLEVYLKRVFTESALIESTSFRGIYLTSGLQTGVPIAKVCGKLLGETGAGDARALESLFTNQRAYFIKDLIRHRVFGERGLVRPTEGRVLRARRNAILGYGASAVVAVLAVIGAIVYLVGERSDNQVEAYDSAVAAAEKAVDPSLDPNELLKALARIEVATKVDEELMPEVFGTTKESFEELYAELFDERMVPTIRSALIDKLAVVPDPGSWSEFLAIQNGAALLLDELDFDDEDHRATVGELVDDVVGTVRVSRFDPGANELEYDVVKAMKRRAELGGETVSRATADTLARAGDLKARMRELWNGAIDGAAWQPGGKLGYMIAWYKADKLSRKIADYAKSSGGAYTGSMVDARDYALALEKLGELNVREIQGADVDDELFELFKMQSRFREQSIETLGEDDDPWPEVNDFRAFSDEQIDKGIAADLDVTINPVNIFFSGIVGRMLTRKFYRSKAQREKQIQVPTQYLKTLIENDEELVGVCEAAPQPGWTPADLLDIRDDRERVFSEGGAGAERLRALLLAKWRDFALEFLEDYKSWSDVAEAFPPEKRLRGVDVSNVVPLALVRDQLVDWDPDLFRRFQDHLNQLFGDHLDRATRDDRARDPLTSDAEDWEWFGAVSAIAGGRGAMPGLTSTANAYREGPLRGYESELMGRWTDRGNGRTALQTSIDELNAELERMAAVDLVQLGDGDPLVTLSSHEGWLAGVDEFFSQRLSKHLETRTRLIRPEATDYWSTKGSVADEIEELLSPERVNRVILDLGKSDALDPSDPSIMAGRAVRRARELPKLRTMLAEYGSLDLEAPGDVNRSAHVQRARSLASFLRERDVDDKPHLLAKELVDRAGENGVDSLLADDRWEPKDGGDVYARAVWDGAIERCRNRVRDRYLREIAKAVFEEEVLRESLWRAELDDPGEHTDQRVVEALNELLAPDAKLDQRREDYRMRDGTDLYPDEAYLADCDENERDWWAVERFLTKLHEFFYPEGSKESELDEVELAVEFSVRAGDATRGIWAPASTHRVTFYGETAPSRRTPAFRDSRQEFESMDWSFAPGRTSELWLRWTNRTSWDRNKGSNDLEFTVPGILAPLLLAWTAEDNEPEEREFDLELEVEGHREPIPLRMKLGTAASRLLPDRPKLPSRLD